MTGKLPAPDRILVINVTRIGDTLLTTPVLGALAAAWPKAEITFAGHPKRVEVIENNPFVSQVLPITKRRALFMGRLGGKRYDLALVFGFDPTLVEYGLRVADRVVAFRQQDESINRRLFAIAGEDGYSPPHAVHFLLRMVRPLGIEPAGLALSYRPTPEEGAWARETLARCKAEGRPLVGLQVASFPTKAFRDWPLESFIALCERVREMHPGVHFLIFGGSLETERTEALYRRFSDCSTLFAGKLSLRQTAALMSLVDAYVGVDTGPTHIMGSLHRPLVAMYHPTSPSTVLGPLEHPCFFAVDHPKVGLNPTIETPMAEIPVDTVLERLEAALAWRPGDGAAAPGERP